MEIRVLGNALRSSLASAGLLKRRKLERPMHTMLPGVKKSQFTLIADPGATPCGKSTRSNSLVIDTK